MVYFGFPVSPRMLFDIWDCPDLPDAHRTLIEKLKRFFKDEKVTFYSRAKGTGKLRAVGFSGSPSPRNLIVSLVTAVSVRSRLLGQRIAALSPEISGVAEQEPRQVRGLFGEHHCFHSFAGVFHRMTPGAPWPENPFLHEALARWVSEIVLPGCEVPEYGAGYLFAPHIAGKSGSVTCVDAEPGVIPEISVNLELNNLPNASVALDNLADFSSTSRAEVCIVNLDRQGMSPETSRNMFAGRVAQVIAIGRDMARVKKAHRNLLDAGFSLKRVRAFDPAPAKPDVLAVTEYGR